jgi:NTP pyrophosphatase (non-canonical NTP hydrolase)
MKILIEIKDGEVASVVTTENAEIKIINHDKKVQSRETVYPDAIATDEGFATLLEEAFIEALQPKSAEAREYYTVFVIMDDTDGIPVGVTWVERLAKEEAKEREEDGHSYSVKTVDMDGIATLVDAYFKFRGLTNPDAAQSFLFLTSEMGEVADAIVQDQAKWTRNNPQNKDGSVQKIREELGDVLMMLTKTSQGYGGDPISDMIAKFKKKGFVR